MIQFKLHKHVWAGRIIVVIIGYCKNLQREHGQVLAFSDEWPVHDHDNPLPDSGRPAYCVQYPGYCKNLQRQHGQVQAFSDEWPVHDHDNPLPDSGRPAFCVQYPG